MSFDAQRDSVAKRLHISFEERNNDVVSMDTLSLLMVVH